MQVEISPLKTHKLRLAWCPSVHPPFPAAEVPWCPSHLHSEPRSEFSPRPGRAESTAHIHPCALTHPTRLWGCRFPRQLNISFSCTSHRPSFLPGHPSCHGGSNQTSPIPVRFTPAEASSHLICAASHLLYTFLACRCLSVLLKCAFSLKLCEPARDTGAATV